MLASLRLHHHTSQFADGQLVNQQVRRVLDQIRGKSYEEALMILEYMPYRACESIIKLLVSVRCAVMAIESQQCVWVWIKHNPSCPICLQAGANAKENLGLRKIRLYISECYCDEGPILKRIKTRAKGRYTSHTFMHSLVLLGFCIAHLEY